MTTAAVESITAADLVTRLRARYEYPEWLVADEVTLDYQGKSFRADAMAINLWVSRALHLHGFEIKVPWLRLTHETTANRTTGPEISKMPKIHSFSKNLPIPAARMPVTAFPVKMTGDSGAKRPDRRAIVNPDLARCARISANYRGLTTAEVVTAWNAGMIWCRIDRHWWTPKKPRGQKNALCPACYARRER